MAIVIAPTNELALCLFLRQRLIIDVGKKNEEPERQREVRMMKKSRKEGKKE